MERSAVEKKEFDDFCEYVNDNFGNKERYNVVSEYLEYGETKGHVYAMAKVREYISHMDH
ncbi:MAG: hypothetical protein FWG51_01050 [Firmicutes bacterium]|nr:hypothetical protein [Bacillota bacterium]